MGIGLVVWDCFLETRFRDPSSDHLVSQQSFLTSLQPCLHSRLTDNDHPTRLAPANNTPTQEDS